MFKSHSVLLWSYFALLWSFLSPAPCNGRSFTVTRIISALLAENNSGERESSADHSGSFGNNYDDIVRRTASPEKANEGPKSYLTEADFERGRKLLRESNGRQHVDRASLFRAGRYQGDIVGYAPSASRPVKNANKFGSNGEFARIRFAATQINRLWPNAQIPYTISPQYNEIARAQIAAAINEFHQKTCIRFVARTFQTDYLYVFPGDGCYSGFGRQGGLQETSLDSDCLKSLGVVIHELMHNVGFLHEHSRPDRDSYVGIMWQNILPEYLDDFRKHDDANTLGLAYDYDSIMHYGANDFSSNGLPTIVPKQPGVSIGQEKGLSAGDVLKINTLYGCNSATNRLMAYDALPAAFSPSFAMTNTGPGIAAASQQLANGICFDKRSDCAFLQSMHFCSVFPAMMRDQCPSTCGMCAPSSATLFNSASGPTFSGLSHPSSLLSSQQSPFLPSSSLSQGAMPGHLAYASPSFLQPSSSSPFHFSSLSSALASPLTQQSPQHQPQQHQPSFQSSFGSAHVGGVHNGLPAAICQDMIAHCDVWASSGYCYASSYVNYMSISCRRSCRFC